MSGGVDSAVAAYLTKQQGYEIAGVTLSLSPEGEENACCTKADIDDAASVADSLGAPFFVLDYSEVFKTKVIDYFAHAYERGLTPNPCVVCNRNVKFAALCDYAKNNGFDIVVTGHYCRKEYSEKYGRNVLRIASDLSKDQSYVLWSLTSEQIDMLYFPLGELTKVQVRAIAEQNGFVNARKKDSQDICFIKGIDYADYIERYLGRRFPQGNFVDTQGNILGSHKGIIRYTVGQRKGLGLALPAPMYVKSKDIAKNEVVLCSDSELFDGELYAGNINLLAIGESGFPTDCLVKARYSHRGERAKAELCGDRMKITFESPQRALTPGQSAVLYDSDGIILAGGEII